MTFEAELKTMAISFKLGLEEILTEWSRESSSRPLGYKYNWNNHELIIYTSWPGIFIGNAGETISKYQKKLNEYLYEKGIGLKFIEIDGIVGGKK